MKAYIKLYWLEMIAVFGVYFISGKFGQALFYGFELSPAVIWPPIGIALAAVFLFGVPMLIPIALAQFAITLTNPTLTTLTMTVVILAITTSIAYPLQAYVWARTMRSYGFNQNLEQIRDALLLIAVTVSTLIIAPLIITFVRSLFDVNPDTATASVVRLWAGGVFSAIVITPLILTWASYRSRSALSVQQRTELIIALLALGSFCYLSFWTTLYISHPFIVLYSVTICLFWIALRFHPSIMCLAIFIVATLGISGSILNAPDTLLLSRVLFAGELSILFIAPIFFVLAAVVEENRKANTNLQRYNLQLEDSLQKLAEDDKSKNEFIAILAHELRNPLAAIVSTFEVLSLTKDATNKEEAEAFISSAGHQAHYMRRILDDLLDLSRVRQQKFRLRFETVELQPLIKHALNTVDINMKEQSHTLTINLPEEPVKIIVDPIRFNQILVNLLNNAAKYTEPGGKISLIVRATSGYVTISVKDNGIGIDPSEIDEIFTPFRQLRAVPAMGTGLGIGLALTKDLVEMHGGTISAHSAGHDKGSEFIVTLPRTGTSSTLQKQELRPAKSGAVGDVDQCNILIVDDNETAAKGLAKLLELKGHNVRMAHTGTQGLTLASTFKPDIIFLDIGLPDIDGYEVVDRLKDAGSKSKIVAVTGYGLPDDRNRINAHKFDHHVTKPVGLDELLETIKLVLSR